jgi:hypothetical protein
MGQLASNEETVALDQPRERQDSRLGIGTPVPAGARITRLLDEPHCQWETVSNPKR